MPWLIAALYLAHSALGAPQAPDQPGAPASLTIVATGDVIPHGTLRATAASAATEADPEAGWRAFWEPVAPLLSRADLTFLNHETPIAPLSGPEPRAFLFDAPPAFPRALAQLGVDVVSLANNHALDQGFAGLGETIAHVADAGLTGLGLAKGCAAAWQPQITEKNGIRVAWIATTQALNSAKPTPPQDESPCLAVWERPLVASAIRTARAQADFVIVSVHWGAEYQTTPGSAQKADARWLAEQGADVVLGHHPHVLQPVAWITTPEGHRTFVAYSLGNALSNQGWRVKPGVSSAEDSEVRLGLALQLTVHKNATDAPAILSDVSGVVLWTDSDAQRVFDPRATLRVRRLSDLVSQAPDALKPWWLARWEQARTRLQGLNLR